jgi:ribonuclease J
MPMSVVEIIPLGGAGEIGKNCTIVRQDDDIIVLDCGLSFPNEEMFGVDIVIPDFTYLFENTDKVRAVFLTHAHEDHVGALPYLLAKVKCPVYASEFTHAMIRTKLDEKIGLKDLDLRSMQFGDVIEAGSLSVEPVRITHSIPENSSLAVRTKHGVVFLTGDFKFDFTPVDGKLSNITRLGEIGQEGVVLLLSDSTNIDRPGWGPSEKSVTEGLLKVFREAEGRVLLTTFASNVHRMQQVFDVAVETGRKVAIVGRRMEQVAEICTRLGYMKAPPGVRIKLEEVKEYEPHRVAILTTGSQGEPMSALVQMSKGTYGRLQIHEGDTLIYSARPIPGNEAAIWRTINRLFRQGANVLYESEVPIHVSGHGYQEELKMMVNLLRPFYIAPVHGEPRHQHLYRQMALEMGYPEHRVFTLEDGLTLRILEKTAEIGDKVPCGRVLVDNAGTPGLTDEVLRDRFNLANDGIVSVTVAIDPERGELVGKPVMQSKGFSGKDGSLGRVQDILEDSLEDLVPSDLRDVDKLRHLVSDLVRRTIQREANLRPLVLPTIVEV